MNTRDQLNQYLQGLEKRMRWLAVSKGAAVAAGVALGATLALVLITNALAFSSSSMTVARVVLFVALAAAVGFALVIPLMHLNRRKAAGRAETSFPEFQERLLTYVERSEKRDPMLELLAMDTMSVAQRTQPELVAPRKSIFALATSAGALGAVLLWLILAGPGFLGYGASLLWAGAPKAGAARFYEITVQPGNKLIRRRSDQVITAQLSFEAPQVRLFAKYASTAKWEEAQMAPRNGTSYEFLFAGVPEPVEYYVEASGVKSPTYKLDVVDLPGIKHIKVTYHFPAWLGSKAIVEDPGGDLRAVAGTVAELTVTTDRPLGNGIIEVDDGSHIALESNSDGTLTGKVPIQKDGVFHFAAKEQGESVRLSEDYFIEARVDGAPTVKITHPGSDARVNPIEEVGVTVEASDDFALQGVELHYSVNGGAEKVVPIPNSKGVQNASGKTLIALEDYKMEPGDVIALYATAKDAHVTSRTDMVFVQAEPFERNYSQSQQGGGMGGGGGDDGSEISQRQKEIIAATWNELRGNAKDKAAENARFLAEVQTKLKEQAQSLAQRSRSRELAGANQEFQNFVKDLEAAAAEMDPASEKLKGQNWKDALVPEQKALQHLLRAEATFRDIQVAFGSGGGGGGGQNAGRDLSSMFDLELDREKNQYETGQSGGNSAEQRQKEADEALQKLSDLARRQKELAEQQNQSKQQSFEQRWQQEMLRREAEELRKQMEQLSKSGQGQQGQGKQSSSSGQQQSQSGEASGQSGQQGGQLSRNQQRQQNQQNQQQLQQALDRINQALNDMRSAQQSAQQSGQQSSAGTQAEARRAAERLAEAQRMMNGMRQQQASSQVDDLSKRAEGLKDEQKDFEQRLGQAFGRGAQQGGRNGSQIRDLAEEKDKMAEAVGQLEKDMQKAARDLAGTQPSASARVRDGLSDIQQNETKLRMQYSARYIREGQGRLMVPREAPITQSLEQLSRDLKAAQAAVNPNAQPGDGKGGLEQELARLENLREQMQQMAQQRGLGQPNGQNGQQPGQGKGQGKQGQGQGQGQQSGQGQQGSQGQQGNGRGGGGGPQGGSPQYGGGYNGRMNGGNGSLGRFQPEGIYEPNGTAPVEPGNLVRDAQAQMNDLRDRVQDLSKQVQDLSRDLSRLSVGSTASAELEARLAREILPRLEALEVQLRRSSADLDSGQVRSGAGDRVAPGYTDAVAEYFRKLSKGR
jgi:hypothetical protein